MMTKNQLAAARAGLTQEGPARFAGDNGWDASNYLVELCALDSYPELEKLARRVARTPAELQYFVQNACVFQEEPGEIFQSPLVTAARGVGDCDCQARLFCTMARGIGSPTALAFLEDTASGEPSHVWPMVWDAGAWRHCETTVYGCGYDEHPVDAAIRSGLVRPDIVSTMGRVVVKPIPTR
jgi:transglutaminase-like putative cysteine protease